MNDVDGATDGSSLPAMDDAASAKSLRWLIQITNSERGLKPSTPSSILRQRLAELDGREWLEARLRMAPFALLGNPTAALVDGRASLAELEELRLRCKRITAQATSRDLLLAAVAGYFFAIGAALLHHRRYTSSQPIRELREILIDLATVADEPWSSFLSRAAFAEPQRGVATPER